MLLILFTALYTLIFRKCFCIFNNNPAIKKIYVITRHNNGTDTISDTLPHSGIVYSYKNDEAWIFSKEDAHVKTIEGLQSARRCMVAIAAYKNIYFEKINNSWFPRHLQFSSRNVISALSIHYVRLLQTAMLLKEKHCAVVMVVNENGHDNNWTWIEEDFLYQIINNEIFVLSLLHCMVWRNHPQLSPDLTYTFVEEDILFVKNTSNKNVIRLY